MRSRAADPFHAHKTAAFAGHLSAISSTRQWRDTGREAARQNGFSGSGQPANRDERRLRWTDRQLRKFEIGTCRPHDISLVVTNPGGTSEQHIGANSGAQRHEQRKGCERVEIFDGRVLKISVEKGVRSRMPTIADEIHDWERKIVEHIDRRDIGVELDRIEQNGLAFDQHDVRQMQVAVATPYKSLFAPLPLTAREFGITRIETHLRVHRYRVWKTGGGSKRCGIAVDEYRQSTRSTAPPARAARRRGRPRWRRQWRRPDRDPAAGFCQMIDSLALVEASHFDRKFDRCHRLHRYQAIHRCLCVIGTTRR